MITNVDLKDSHFRLEELVSPEIFDRFGAAAIRFIDPVAFNVLCYYRSRYGTTYVNTYALDFDRPRRYSGVRPLNCIVGAEYSAHKFGKAFDPVTPNARPEEIYEDIINSPEKWLEAGLRRIEDIEFTPSWIHLDTLTTNSHDLQIIKP